MEKKLKNLNRKELIDIIYKLKKNEQIILSENEKLKAELENKRIMISESGSVAEAAVSLSSVFSAAQKAADLYLEEISQRQKEIENDYEKIINEAKSQAESIISDAEAQRDAVIEEVKRASVFLKKYKKLMEKKDVSFETSNISE